jgi:hypothetical protein
VTKKKDSDQTRQAQPEHSGLRARRERRERAREQLAELSPFDLADVLFRELDRRRLDANGNPTDPEGLYLAVMAGISVILGESVTPQDQVMAERVAGVGRGVVLQAENGAALMRELATLAEAFRDTDRIAANDRAPMIARTLSKRFGREVRAEDVEKALAAPKLENCVTALAFAARIVTGHAAEEADWKRAYDSVRKAIKWRGTLGSTD